MYLESLAFDLDELLASCASTFALTAESKRIGLVSSIEPDAPRAFVGDPTRIRQILLNLLGNAFKFTSEGNVILRAERLDVQGATEPGQRARVAISVRDTGIGISEEQQKGLFESFTQADSSTTRRFGGTGLGLAISRNLCDLMGGTLHVESRLGEGSCFTLELPLEIARPDAVHLPRLASLEARKVLVVDDDPVLIEVLREQTESWGMEVRLAYDGPDALEALRAAHAEGAPFDLVCLDYEMPTMSGFEVASAMQSDAALRDVPRLLLTAMRTTRPQDELREAGLELVVDKPTSALELRRAFALALGLGRDAAPRKRSPLEGREAFRGIRVLVVEDNRVNAMVARGMLHKLGAQVRVEENGRLAVDAFSAADPPFDLVLMDCELPVMDGYEATVQIRRFEMDEGRTPTPILALSAHVLEETSHRVVACGMNGRINKPVVVTELVSVLEEIAAKRSGWGTRGLPGREASVDD